MPFPHDYMTDTLFAVFSSAHVLVLLRNKVVILVNKFLGGLTGNWKIAQLKSL